ncbi:porin [bacterium]|nr:porin [bacterium]
MNKFKKIGLSALAGSLVATSVSAGEMSVAGSASLALEHINGGGANTGKSFTMGNQLTFSGSGELDNGLNVSLSFILDQGDEGTSGEATSPFDSHSVTVSSDALGSLVFSGEGGSSATSAIDGTAAGDVWDNFDGSGDVTPTGVGTGDNMMMYTLPAIMDGVSANVSYVNGTTGKDSAMGWSVTYTGIEGLSASYGVGEDTSVGNVGEGTAFKATYAYGPVTVGYSMYEFDTATASADNETTSYAITYTVNDELSVTWASEEIDETGDVEKVETSSIRASYVMGGMTITAAMEQADNLDGSATATKDRERWALGASFAF